MSNVAVLRTERMHPDPDETPPYLGPAVVTAVRPNEIEVRLKSGRVVAAAVALASPYDPALDDIVLVIGNEGGHYVIGVLHGKGRAVLEFDGDVDVRARGGVLRLSGDRGVEIASQEVSVQAGVLRVLAGAVVERFTSLRQRVAELWSVHAGQSHTVVDETSHAQARRATIVTEERMKINGREIYLG